MKTAYKTKHRRAEAKQAKIADKLIGVDVMARLHGKKVTPRCPSCHKPLLVVYLSKVVWLESSESFPVKFTRYNTIDLGVSYAHDCYCACGAVVTSIVKLYQEVEKSDD